MKLQWEAWNGIQKPNIVCIQRICTLARTSADNITKLSRCPQRHDSTSHFSWDRNSLQILLRIQLGTLQHTLIANHVTAFATGESLLIQRKDSATTMYYSELWSTHILEQSNGLKIWLKCRPWKFNIRQRRELKKQTLQQKHCHFLVTCKHHSIWASIKCVCYLSTNIMTTVKSWLIKNSKHWVGWWWS